MTIQVKRSIVNISSIIFLLAIGLLVAVSCNKEYSFEGDLPDPVVIVPGGAGTGNGLYPFCNDCKGHDKFEYGRWSFWVGNSFFCGRVTDGVASPDRKGFTFFGPSTCSADTGLIMTIYLHNNTLMGDKYNIVSTKTLMQYYDNITPSDMFVSQNNAEMTLIVDQYIQSTLISRGRFFGKVYDKQGSVINVTNGKFEFKFRN